MVGAWVEAVGLLIDLVEHRCKGQHGGDGVAGLTCHIQPRTKGVCEGDHRGKSLG